ncbi:MAG: hypothetical protein WC498_01340 [Candidatus Saccharimonadales bacterium]
MSEGAPRNIEQEPVLSLIGRVALLHLELATRRSITTLPLPEVNGFDLKDVVTIGLTNAESVQIGEVVLTPAKQRGAIFDQPQYVLIHHQRRGRTHETTTYELFIHPERARILRVNDSGDSGLITPKTAKKWHYLDGLVNNVKDAVYEQTGEA